MQRGRLAREGFSALGAAFEFRLQCAEGGERYEGCRQMAAAATRSVAADLPVRTGPIGDGGKMGTDSAQLATDRASLSDCRRRLEEQHAEVHPNADSDGTEKQLCGPIQHRNAPLLSLASHREFAPAHLVMQCAGTRFSTLSRACKADR
jgi:hypothetical protein